MLEFFDTISSYINKIVTFFDTFFTTLKESIAELKNWAGLLPLSLVSALAIIIVLLVIFRVLGR